MRRSASPTLLLALLPLAGAGCAQPAQEEPEASGSQAGAETAEGTTPDSALVEGLREGEYVIYFRHAATEAGGVSGTETLGDRDAQRNLSREGREQSEAIGEAFEELDVPVGEVLSSPYFRNTDTAELAFGRAQPTEDLLGLLSVEGEDEERNRRFLRDQLSTRPAGRATPCSSATPRTWKRSPASRWRRARPRSTSRSGTAISSCARGSCPRSGETCRDPRGGHGPPKSTPKESERG
jgi:Histidine phosphatase superfamily (branch 1)